MNPDQNTRLSPFKRQSNGNFILQTYGSPGENFDLRASTDLETWEDLGIMASARHQWTSPPIHQETNSLVVPRSILLHSSEVKPRVPNKNLTGGKQRPRRKASEKWQETH